MSIILESIQMDQNLDQIERDLSTANHHITTCDIILKKATTDVGIANSMLSAVNNIHDGIYESIFTIDEFISDRDITTAFEGFGDIVREYLKKIMDFIEKVIKEFVKFFGKIFNYFSNKKRVIEQQQKQLNRLISIDEEAFTKSRVPVMTCMAAQRLWDNISVLAVDVKKRASHLDVTSYHDLDIVKSELKAIGYVVTQDGNIQADSYFKNEFYLENMTMSEAGYSLSKSKEFIANRKKGHDFANDIQDAKAILEYKHNELKTEAALLRRQQAIPVIKLNNINDRIRTIATTIKLAKIVVRYLVVFDQSTGNWLENLIKHRRK